jgi:hypothetical protein
MMRLILALALLLPLAARAQTYAPLEGGHLLSGGQLIQVTSTTPVAQDPGPSAALFASPYYTCSTNYYVSQTGNDTTGTGTSGNPWLTLAHANSQLATNTGGQCVNVAPSGTVYSGLRRFIGVFDRLRRLSVSNDGWL